MSNKVVVGDSYSTLVLYYDDEGNKDNLGFKAHFSAPYESSQRIDAYLDSDDIERIRDWCNWFLDDLD